MQTLKPFFSYFGGKWRLTENGYYPEPAHGTIIEPFAGAAGYSLHYPQHQVVLCDRDPVIASIWRYLIDASEDEILSLPDVPPGHLVSDLPVCQPAKWLIGFWVNKNNTHPCNTPSAWMRSGKYPNQFWSEHIRTRIASQLRHIRHWRVHHSTYSKAQQQTATWFVDPPYMSDTRRAGKRYRHGALYIDYRHLAEWCQQRAGQVIVCESDRATWLPFRNLVRSQALIGYSHEAIWTNDV